MKLSKTIGMLALTGWCLTAPAQGAEMTRYRDIDWSEGWGAFMDVLGGRLELGTRVSEFTLETTRTAPTPEDDFLGNLYRLEAEQNTAPTKIFADFNIIKYWGVEWTWDEMAARPYNFVPEDAEDPTIPERSDGKLTVEGPILATYGRYPVNLTDNIAVVPFVGVGYAFWKADFEEDTWWAYGYGSPEAFAADPNPSAQGAERRIDVKDDPTSFYYLGADVFITPHWAAQVYYRQMDMDIDAEFYYINELRDSGSFPMSSTWWAFGVKYAF
jgi:hypothetical protein